LKSFYWLWGYVKMSRWPILFSMLVLALEQIVQTMAQGSQKFLIDDVFLSGEYGKLKWVLLYFTVTYLASYALNWWGNYLTRMNQLALHHRMGSSMMEVIQRKTVSEIQNQRTAKWVQYFTSDIQNVASFVSTELPKGIQQFAGVLFLIGIIAFASPGILLLVAVFSAIYIALGRYFGPINRQQTREMQERRGELLVKIEEGIASTREVIAYNRNEWEESKYRTAFAAFFDKVMENGKLANSQLLLSNAVQWIGRIGVLVYGGYSVIKGDLTLGMFVVTYQYSNQLFTNLQTVFNFFMNMSGRLAYVERVRELFEQAQMEDGTIPLTEPVKSIRLERVKFAYSDEGRMILNDLSIEFPAGSKIAIVGTSGGGKSTITQLLLRFFEPTEGRILVNGIPLNEIRTEDWMAKLAVVFQEPFLLPDTIRGNLMLGREHVSEEQMLEACRIAQIDEFIEALENGFDTVVGERGYTLSGGQRQRLAIARAIAGDPDILILDEATSALDMETERRMQTRLDEIRKGKTTFVIAHRLSTVRNADVIFVMDQGRLAEYGTHEELMDRGQVYRRLVSLMSDSHKPAVMPERIEPRRRSRGAGTVKPPL
jgi:ABC-type multidrug transport system fused ATPase/permease subunit